MSPDILIVIAGLATAVCVVSSLYGVLKKEPSAQVTVKTNGKTEAFRISPEDAARLRVVLEREAQNFREHGPGKPRTDGLSMSS
jgi:hypothetical protein